MARPSRVAPYLDRSGPLAQYRHRQRGRINKRMMRELIAPIFKPMIERGCYLFPEQEQRAKQERRKHQEFVMQHKEYMNALISWSGRADQLHLSSRDLQRFAL
jgi:hypothetical protein